MYGALLNQLSPGSIDMNILSSEENMERRANMIVEISEKLRCHDMVDSTDIINVRENSLKFH